MMVVWLDHAQRRFEKRCPPTAAIQLGTKRRHEIRNARQRQVRYRALEGAVSYDTII
jgi:hypothetical protein